MALGFPPGLFEKLPFLLPYKRRPNLQTTLKGAKGSLNLGQIFIPIVNRFGCCCLNRQVCLDNIALIQLGHLVFP